VESLTIAVVSSAIGGVAGKLTEKAWDSGKRWLTSYFKDHHPKAIKKAEQNALHFLMELAERVKQLEEEMKNDEALKQKITSALEDPDFSSLLKDALIASSKTEAGDKHKILARLVSERLRQQSDSLAALTASLSCRAVELMTIKQLRFLAVAAVVFFVRPPQLPPTISVGKYVDWLAHSLSPFLPIESLHMQELLHLEALSCLRYEFYIERDLKQILSGPFQPGGYWEIDRFIHEDPIGKQLFRVWKEVLQHVHLTTVGVMVGVYVHDELTGTRTRMTC